MLCTFGILCCDRARLPNALLPSIENVLGRSRVVQITRPAALLFDREQERDRSPQLPRRSASRAYRVVIGGNRCIHWLITHSKNATEATADRRGPLPARCREPVRGDDGACGQVPAVRHVVVEEGLGEEGIDGRPQWIAPDRPLVIEQYQCPGVVRNTAVGPNRNLPVPRIGSLADGTVKTGPTPQMSLPGCVGEKNND